LHTEWGYFIGAAPKGHPTIVSRSITPEYTGQICKKAFLPGKLNGELILLLDRFASEADVLSPSAVPSSPNVTKINQYGSFDLSYPRLAFIDGSADRKYSPWQAVLTSCRLEKKADGPFRLDAAWIGATPHSPHAKERKDTLSKPFKLIPEVSTPIPSLSHPV
jgi:hypothetical protein